MGFEEGFTAIILVLIETSQPGLSRLPSLFSWPEATPAQCEVLRTARLASWWLQGHAEVNVQRNHLTCCKECWINWLKLNAMNLEHFFDSRSFAKRVLQWCWTPRPTNASQLASHPKISKGQFKNWPLSRLPCVAKKQLMKTYKFHIFHQSILGPRLHWNTMVWTCKVDLKIGFEHVHQCCSRSACWFNAPWAPRYIDENLTGACFINALFVPHVSHTCTPEPPGMMIGAAAAGLPKVVKANSEPLFINGRGARESIDDCQSEPPNRPGHRWSLFQASKRPRCIDEPGVTTRSASMNGVWNPKVHRWMRYETQKCIDEWGTKPKSASMNGVRNPKVHRWIGYET